MSVGDVLGLILLIGFLSLIVFYALKRHKDEQNDTYEKRDN